MNKRQNYPFIIHEIIFISIFFFALIHPNHLLHLVRDPPKSFHQLQEDNLSRHFQHFELSCGEELNSLSSSFLDQ